MPLRNQVPSNGKSVESTPARNPKSHTESEVLKLYFALGEASLGDRNIMAGAVEFCLILAENMDMGLNTLIAAAFHYSWCISAEK